MQKAGGMSGRRGLFGGGVISAFRPFGAASGTGRGLYGQKQNALRGAGKKPGEAETLCPGFVQCIRLFAQSAGKLSLSWRATTTVPARAMTAITAMAARPASPVTGVLEDSVVEEVGAVEEVEEPRR